MHGLLDGSRKNAELDPPLFCTHSFALCHIVPVFEGVQHRCSDPRSRSHGSGSTPRATGSPAWHCRDMQGSLSTGTPSSPALQCCCCPRADGEADLGFAQLGRWPNTPYLREKPCTEFECALRGMKQPWHTARSTTSGPRAQHSAAHRSRLCRPLLRPSNCANCCCPHLPANAQQATAALSQLDRVSILAEALPYMQKFAGKTIVVKYGGAAMKDPTLKVCVCVCVCMCFRAGARGWRQRASPMPQHADTYCNAVGRRA